MFKRWMIAQRFLLRRALNETANFLNVKTTSKLQYIDIVLI